MSYQSVVTPRWPRLGVLVAAATTLALSAFVDVQAAERGKFKGRSVLVSVQFHEINAPEGNPAKAVQIGELDGVLFNDTGKTFLDKAHYQVVWKGDGNGAGECFKTFTDSAGKVFANCVGRTGDNGEEQGTITLVGGTGAYAGIKGKGVYKLKMVSERAMWDVIEFDYEIP
ncbi:MAG: hypothetical protein KIS79_13935 [Burkholderiales bacterium]|nr:hypothetical protein [Burkholderiales bacterium]